MLQFWMLYYATSPWPVQSPMRLWVGSGDRGYMDSGIVYVVLQILCILKSRYFINVLIHDA